MLVEPDDADAFLALFNPTDAGNGPAEPLIPVLRSIWRRLRPGMNPSSVCWSAKTIASTGRRSPPRPRCYPWRPPAHPRAGHPAQVAAHLDPVAGHYSPCPSQRRPTAPRQARMPSRSGCSAGIVLALSLQSALERVEVGGAISRSRSVRCQRIRGSVDAHSQTTTPSALRDMPFAAPFPQALGSGVVPVTGRVPRACQSCACRSCWCG